MQNNREKSLCFTGHRDEKLPTMEKEITNLKEKLFEKISAAIESGITTFYFGGCRGFDLLCAEQVLLKKQLDKLSYSDIYLVAVVPYIN